MRARPASGSTLRSLDARMQLSCRARTHLTERTRIGDTDTDDRVQSVIDSGSGGALSIHSKRSPQTPHTLTRSVVHVTARQRCTVQYCRADFRLAFPHQFTLAVSY